MKASNPNDLTTISVKLDRETLKALKELEAYEGVAAYGRRSRVLRRLIHMARMDKGYSKAARQLTEYRLLSDK